MVIVRLEDADNIWPSILRRHFNINIVWPRLNQSKHGYVMDFFDKEKIDLVMKKESWIIDNYYPFLRDVL